MSLIPTAALTPVNNPDCGYSKKFEHTIMLPKNCIPSEFIHWCNENCIYRWGWYFAQGPGHPLTTFISFESYDEMIIFKLNNIVP